MIDIYLHSEYRKDFLKDVLKAIEEFAPRELTYSFHSSEVDVSIQELLKDDIEIFEALAFDYPEDINILITSSGYTVVYQKDFITLSELNTAIKEVIG